MTFDGNVQMDPILEVEKVCSLAKDASSYMSTLDGQSKSYFLRFLADQLEYARDELINLLVSEQKISKKSAASQFTAMMSQLSDFARVIERGNWVNARIDPPQLNRKPVPKPDMRAMLRPLGPVAVFCSDEAPLAFSIVGRDVMSAWASGCPVVVKVSDSCNRIRELFERVINKSLHACEMPTGCISLLVGNCDQFAQELVKNLQIKAVAYTGPREEFRHCSQAIEERDSPILAFEKVESQNPLFVLPGFCMKQVKEFFHQLHSLDEHQKDPYYPVPRLVFYPGDEIDSYLGGNNRMVLSLLERNGYKIFSSSWKAFSSKVNLVNDLERSLCLFSYQETKELYEIVSFIESQWVVYLFGSEDDFIVYEELFESLELKSGELLFNQLLSFNNPAEEHVFGGPIPVSGDVRTSHYPIGLITRFSRPVCYQNFPDEFLPKELQMNNPLGISRDES